MIQSESIVKLAVALSKAQGALKGAKKDSVNPHFKAAYADLESSWEACREQLAKNGLSVVQMPFSSEGRIGVSTRLMHESGEWIEGEVSVAMAQPTNPQNAGSIITYLRRYSLQGTIGIAPEDDDANAASPKPGAKMVESKPANPAPVIPPSGAVENQASAPPAPQEEKSLDDMRREMAELSQIAVDQQRYHQAGDAIQEWCSDEKFASKCRSVEGLKKDWAVKKAYAKCLAEMHDPIDDVLT